jgi:hypothetical protein
MGAPYRSGVESVFKIEKGFISNLRRCKEIDKKDFLRWLNFMAQFVLNRCEYASSLSEDLGSKRRYPRPSLLQCGVGGSAMPASGESLGSRISAHF